MSLAPTFVLGDLDLTATPFAVEFGSDLGSPETVYEVLLTALADGEAVTSDRVSNRKVTLTVLVEGTDMEALATAEATLIAETEKARNVLTVDPGDEVGPPIAFDTFRAQAVLERDDDGEQHLLRRYVLTIPALPHGRSTESIVTVADEPGVESFVIDDGSTLGTNLLSANASSFETDVSNWTAGGTSAPTLSQSATHAAAGTQAMRVAWNAAAVEQTASVTVSGLTVGKTYVASAQVYVPSGSPAVTIGVAGISDTFPSAYYDTFQIVAYHFVATATSHTIRVTNPTGGAGEVWVDDVRVAQGWGLDQGNVPGTSIAASGTEIVATSVDSGFTDSVALWWLGPIDLSADQYIAVTWTSSIPLNFEALQAWLVDGTTRHKMLHVSSTVSGGVTTSFYRVPAGYTSADGLYFPGGWTVGSGSQTLSIDKISTWNEPPVIGTDRQRNISLIPGGSVRTQGSIAVEHATSALGDVLVYTRKADGFVPALSPFYASTPSRTSDLSTVSGGYVSATAGIYYGLSAAQVPNGRAQLWARVRNATAGTYAVSWSVGNSPTSALAFDADWNTTGVTDVTLAANTWTVVALGEAPSQYRETGTDGYVRVGLTGTVEVDEAWLFVLDDAALTVVDCGTGTPATGGPSNRLWIDAPSIDKPEGGIFQGTLATRSDSHYSTAIFSFMDHNFDPAGMSAFVVTTNAEFPAVSLTHYRRWHTSAAA